MMRRAFGVAVLSAFVYLMASPAKADTVYDWTVSIPLLSGGTLIGSGQLVAASTLSTGYDGKYKGFLVSSITGTYGGSTITGLAAADTITNDNLINTSQALLDLDGLSFYISPNIAWDTTPINLYYKPGSGYTDGGSMTLVNGRFTLTAVPEPGIWSFLLLALFAILSQKRNALGLRGDGRQLLTRFSRR